VLTSSGTAPQWSTQLVNAALPTNIDVGGTLDVTGDTTLDGDIVVTGAGPHAIGGASYGPVGTIFGGSFTSSGASTYAAGILTNQGVTGASGDTASIVGSKFASAIITQTATESIGYIAQLAVEKPPITDNLTGDITVAASVYIKDAPTAGETNAALYVAAGTSYFGQGLTSGTGIALKLSEYEVTLDASDISAGSLTITTTIDRNSYRSIDGGLYDEGVNQYWFGTGTGSYITGGFAGTNFIVVYLGSTAAVNDVIKLAVWHT
jgi:hypothetical protein